VQISTDSIINGMPYNMNFLNEMGRPIFSDIPTTTTLADAPRRADAGFP
jgi:hypothetical protein